MHYVPQVLPNLHKIARFCTVILKIWGGVIPPEPHGGRGNLFPHSPLARSSSPKLEHKSTPMVASFIKMYQFIQKIQRWMDKRTHERTDGHIENMISRVPVDTEALKQHNDSSNANVNRFVNSPRHILPVWYGLRQHTWFSRSVPEIVWLYCCIAAFYSHHGYCSSISLSFSFIFVASSEAIVFPAAATESLHHCDTSPIAICNSRYNCLAMLWRTPL